ncbi:MAG: hypothetical protein M3R48_03635 [Candidatus Dormibacteraeota bacterium]|nr:hypothetical protein [Candidatus Dormibacteraeota bacterium]
MTQAGGDNDHVTGEHLAALAPDGELDAPLEAVQGDGRVSMVLVHHPSGLEHDEHNSQSGLFRNGLGGMVGAAIRVAGTQVRNVRSTIELDHRCADSLALLASVRGLARIRIHLSLPS